VRFLSEPQKGAAAARNRGVAETDAPHLFFLDADCVPASDWLDTALRIRSQADIIGGEVSVFDETPAPRSGAEAFETVFAFDNRGYVENKGFSVTANLLTQRDVFDDVGGFKQAMSEDLEWCRRAGSKGYGLIYAETLRVSHPTRSDWDATTRKWRRITRELFGLRDKTLSQRLKWGVMGLAMMASIVPHGVRMMRSPRLSNMRERFAGLSTLIRLRLLRGGWMLSQAFGKEI
jgi:GT2 family glycosyltransferase